MRFALCVFIALANPVLANPVLANPLVGPAAPLSFEGTIAIGTNDADGGSGIGAIDATMKITMSTRVPLSLEIGTYLFALDSKRPHETYGALAWNDRLRLGAVRPAYDAVLPSVFARAAPYLAYSRAENTRAHATVEAMRRTAVPWGLSFGQEFGEGLGGGLGVTRVDVSVHDASKGGFRSASVALSQSGDGWQVAAAVESVWSDDGTHHGLNTKLGGRYDFGQSTFGLAWLRAEANDRPDTLAIDFQTPLSDRFDLLAFGETSRDRTDDAYGLALDYGMRADTSVLFAVTESSGGGGVHLTLERRF
jgi:hypothetical protein